MHPAAHYYVAGRVTVCADVEIPIILCHTNPPLISAIPPPFLPPPPRAGRFSLATPATCPTAESSTLKPADSDFSSLLPTPSHLIPYASLTIQSIHFTIRHL